MNIIDCLSVAELNVLSAALSERLGGLEVTMARLQPDIQDEFRRDYIEPTLELRGRINRGRLDYVRREMGALV